MIDDIPRMRNAEEQAGEPENQVDVE